MPSSPAVRSHGSRRGSGSEESYASARSDGSQISVLNEPLLPPDRRKRRTKGSSTDRDEVTSDGFILEDYRVGGPILTSVPSWSEPVLESHPLYNLVGVGPEHIQIYEEIRDILRYRAIPHNDFDFCCRRSTIDPEPHPLLTLFVLTKAARADQTWLEACRDIRRVLDAWNRRTANIEIADRRGLELPTIFPVFQTDRVFSVWEKVCEDILKTCDRTDWIALGCYRIGHEERREDNPPTVSLTVSKTSICDWKNTREEIISVLERHTLGMVAVRIVKDKIITNACSFSTAMPLSAVDGPAKVGYSLAPRGYGLASGTFGGYLELRMSKGGSWIPFGITCSHCVLPKEDSSFDT
jgi:hypothetical protein